MAFTKLNFLPGVYKDDTPITAEGYFIDANKIRFERGKAQTIGGWENASNTTLTGICRGIHTWADNSRNPFAAFGTHLRLYEMNSDGEVTDITPVIERGELSSAFSTTLNSITLSVRDDGHNLSVGQKIKFANASSSIAGLSIDGEWTVSSVTSASAYTFDHTSSANATVSSGISTVDYEYFLAPGQIDGLAGLGYGTGSYGSGGYGGSSTGYVLFPRTWALDHWGANLIANPRGGGIYEKRPGTAATELVSSGDFSSSAAWTAGAGWSVGSNVATGTNASTNLLQSITLVANAWHVVDFDVATYSSGSVVPVAGSSTIGTAISAAGTYKRTFYVGLGGAVDFKFAGSAFSGTLDNVSVKALTTAEAITNAPTSVTCAFVTAERILVACGCADTNGNFDALRVRWSDQENNQQWTADPSNLAGSYTLANGSRIVRGLAAHRENLIWTDSSLYRMSYVPDPNVVYRFDLIGTGCGLIGPNAVANVGGVWFWMSPSGEFFAYRAGEPTPLQSTVRRFVKDDLAWVQQDKVFAFPNAGWSEVWWLYPTTSGGTNECDSYVIYDLVDKVWVNGTFNRTAWADADVFQYPISVDSSGGIWFQEKGFTENGAARSWSLTSADFDGGDGDRHILLNGIRPDAEDLQGGYTMTITMTNHDTRGIFERTFGPYAVTSATGQITFRATGQKMRIKWSGNDAPTSWRQGSDQFDIRQTTRRR